MDAVEYLKKRKRMCKGSEYCLDCPLRRQAKNHDDLYECDDCEEAFPEEAVAIVEQWAKDHPVKTYKDVLLEKFPKARVRNEKILTICREDIFGIECPEHNNCIACWNEEYKEE